jgi:flavin-binding protein dodecin
MPRPLENLVERCRSLPWPGAKVASVVVWPSLPEDEGQGDAAPARRRLAELVGALSARLEPALHEALARAAKAWDQVDAVDIVDDKLRARATAVVEEWRALGGPEAALAILTVDAAMDLVRLVERRMATLVRLRVRSRTPELIVDDRPFLDVPAALDEIARRWS